MQNWIKIASVDSAAMQLQPCPKVNFPAWIQENEDKTQQKGYAPHSALHYHSELKPGNNFITELTHLMVWANFTSKRVKEVINGFEPTNPEEIKNISNGASYIKDVVHPVLLHFLHGDPLYFDEHMSENTPQVRALMYSIVTVDIPKSIIEKLKRISRVPFVRKPREVNPDKMVEHMSRITYNKSDKRDHSAMVVRELLQNAVDACIKKNKNTGEEASVWIDIKTPSVLGMKIDDRYELCDILCRDTGVGMSWDTVKEKFFVLFESGKEADIEATGGFGIAKAAIQVTPAHGWTLETNKIVTSRAGRNLYFGGLENESPKNLSETHPIFKSNGTQVSLMGMVAPYFYQITNLIEKFTISNKIKVYLNGRLIAPLFDIAEFKKIDGTMESIIDNALSDQTEDMRFSAKTELAMSLAFKDEDKDIGGFTSGARLFTYPNGKIVQVNILSKPFKKTESNTSSGIYPMVMLNGQFQYEIHNPIMNLHTIIDIHTNIRPSELHYPVTSGRDAVIEEFSDSINVLLEQIRNTCKAISTNRTLEKGAITTILNSSLEGISLSNLGYDHHAPDSATDMGNILNSISNYQDNMSVQQLINEIKVTTKKQSADVDALIAMLYRQDRSRFITKEEIEEFMTQAGTTTSICVEKEYLPNDLVNSNRGVWLSSILLWTFTLKTLMKDVNSFVRKYSPGSENSILIPGIIVSKEALGLYYPADTDTKQPAQVLINPIMICALLYPNCTKRATDGLTITIELLKQMESPQIHSLSVEIFNTGVHELTHFFFPDRYGRSTDNFHLHVTSIQNRCHQSFHEIELKVEQLLDRLSVDCVDIMNMIAQHKKTGSKMEITQNQ